MYQAKIVSKTSRPHIFIGELKTYLALNRDIRLIVGTVVIINDIKPFTAYLCRLNLSIYNVQNTLLNYTQFKSHISICFTFRTNCISFIEKIR